MERQANLEETNVIAVIVSGSLIGSEMDWVVDTGATGLCGERTQFSFYELVKDGGCVMSNSQASSVTGKEKLFF